MTRYANTSGVPLSIAVFLATDNYDHDENTISATALIKPVRQIVLSGRVPTDAALPDLTQMMASRVGSAIHDGIERSWTQNYRKAMEALGIPTRVIDQVKINPTKDQLTEDTIPVYLEQRASKQVGKWLVSGKYDFIGEGRVEDFKSTSVYTAMNNTNDEKYKLQGSIYRWLNPDIITQDNMAIQFIFTDWSPSAAMSTPNYPPNRFQQRIIPLLSVKETDAYVRNKLNEIEVYFDKPEAELPLCSDEDLWRSEPVFKYYKNGDASSKRSTKNFLTRQEAQVHMSTVGTGIVVEKPGEVKACKYCPAFSICSQKDALIASGDLNL